eukprot:jgi/Mesen1/3152/ME000184S02228
MVADENTRLNDSSAPLEVEEAVARKWLARCAPIFLQPAVDIACGHPLLKVFYEFRKEHNTEDQLCELIIVYEGEASYRRLKPTRMNRVATFFYMSFNFVVFGRTADINYLTMTGVDLEAPCGTWSQGNKLNVFNWLSLFYHYGRNTAYEAWERGPLSDRPAVYVNTANHLMGEVNANPSMPLVSCESYALELGGCLEAEHYAKQHVATKAILWRPHTWHVLKLSQSIWQLR